MGRRDNHVQDTLPKAFREGLINFALEESWYSTERPTVFEVTPLVGGSPLLSFLFNYSAKMSQSSTRYILKTFHGGRIPSPPPDFPLTLSPVPPLQDYICGLFMALQQRPGLRINAATLAMQTILFLDHLHRIFPEARTLNPHGLYLATLICAAECTKSCGLEDLAHVDTLFSRELTEEMTSEVRRLLGDILRPINESEVAETWRIMCLDYTSSIIPPDSALPCGDWEGEVADVPAWSRLLCDEDSLNDQLYKSSTNLWFSKIRH